MDTRFRSRMEAAGRLRPGWLAALLAGAWGAGAPGAAPAQWPGDPAVNVPLCTAVENQIVPRIVADGAGGAIVGWLDERTGTDHVYAQRVGPDGVVQWAADGAPVCTKTAVRSALGAASDEQGGAIFTWHEFVAGSLNIFAQRILSDGTRAWPAAGVPVCTASGDQFVPIITADGAGGAFFAWVDNRLVTSRTYVQHLDGAGAPSWEVNGVPVSALLGAQLPSGLLPDGSGGVFVAWQDGRRPYVDGNTDYDVYVQRLSAQGEMLWNPAGVPACGALGFQNHGHLVSDGDGGIIVSWQDLRGAFTYDIYAQRVDAEGTPLWTLDGVGVCTAPGDQNFPEIAPDGTGGAIVVWDDRRLGGLDVYAQRIGGDGVPQWTADGVAVSAASGNQRNNAVTRDAAGGVIVTWQDGRSGQDDVWAQRVDPDGASQWTAGGVPICTAGGDQHAPVIAGTGNGGSIVAWFDFRSGTDFDVYAQAVDAGGNLGSATGASADRIALETERITTWPNPFRRDVALRWSPATRGPVELTIHDAAGRKIARIARGAQGPGWAGARWNGRDSNGRPASPGVYFVRMSSPEGTVTAKMTRVR